MTEDEAKTKWCPFARVSISDRDGNASNRGAGDNAGMGREPLLFRASRCVGSSCMAWRTQHQWFDNAQENPGWVTYPPYAFDAGPDQERDHGYCGLAGQP